MRKCILKVYIRVRFRGARQRASLVVKPSVVVFISKVFPVVGDLDVVPHAGVVVVAVAGLLVQVAWRGIPGRGHIAVPDLLRALQPRVVLQLCIARRLRATICSF